MRIDIGDGFELIGVERADELILVPPCARDDADHATCTWWEDADRGSKAARVEAQSPSSSARASAPAGGKAALAAFLGADRKSTRLNSSHIPLSRMPSSA